jgi:hypothetical protein
MTPRECGHAAACVSTGRCRAVVVDCNAYDNERMCRLLAAVPINRVVMQYSLAATGAGAGAGAAAGTPLPG